MTNTGHILVMIRVAISDLKAKLSAHLRAVRDGETVTILDRRRPIARIVPLDDPRDGLRVRAATVDLASIELPPPAPVPADALDDALAAERQPER